MNELLKKLSSYNLFNYLLPGIIFVVLTKELTKYSFVQNDIALGIFLYYFLGLIISRFGSLVIEPLLKKFTFLKFANFEDFLAASKKDEKLELLSSVNNTYRTLCSLIALLLLLKLYEQIENVLPFLGNWSEIFLLIILLVMFLFSYRKQTNYIKKRINAHK